MPSSRGLLPPPFSSWISVCSSKKWVSFMDWLNKLCVRHMLGSQEHKVSSTSWVKHCAHPVERYHLWEGQKYKKCSRVQHVNCTRRAEGHFPSSTGKWYLTGICLGYRVGRGVREEVFLWLITCQFRLQNFICNMQERK